HLSIAGDGELLEEARALTTQKFASHSVELIGYTHELTKHIDESDALLMPSRWELNPMTIWEAWARGRPVISTELPVFADLARRGPVRTYSGPKEFAMLIAELSSNYAQRLRDFDEGVAAF